MRGAHCTFRSACLLLFPGVVLVGSCEETGFQSGVDVLASSGWSSLEGRAVAVVTNPTGIDRRLRSTVDLLASAPGVHLAAIFGPEHGARGSAEAGIAVQDAVDPRTGAPVFSLYGTRRRPTRAMLEGVDVIVFDIQDVGVRAYTYLSTLVEVLEAAAEHDVEVLVLDRPPPFGAWRVAGPVLEKGFESFVGPHSLPLVHGLTPGEFARLVNEERDIEARLRVSRMKGYRRSMFYEETGLPWVAPSPNIPTPETALLYAGTVLVEGTNLSEGRGTTRPFHLIGAPWVDGTGLAEALEALDLPGVGFREAYFTPTFSKYEGTTCSGVEIHVQERRLFTPVVVAVALLETARKLHPEHFEFREEFFDKLAGTSDLREGLEAGKSYAEIVASWGEGLAKYQERRRGFLLYD